MNQEIIEKLKNSLEPTLCEQLHGVTINDLLALRDILNTLNADNGLCMVDWEHLTEAIKQVEDELHQSLGLEDNTQ